jgi:signal transduction histidine kinase
MRKQIIVFRIWKDNTVVYSDRKEDIGKALQPTEALARAWNGHVAGQLDRLSDEHNPGTLPSGLPVLELYTPVRQQGSDRVIAIAEVYEMVPALKNELSRVKLQAGLLLGAVTFAVVALSYGIVDSGSRMIERQRISLEQRIADLSAVLSESEEAHKRVNPANERVTESDERFLRGISADLHDGPLQLLGLTLLRLDELREVVTTPARESSEKIDQIGLIRDLLAETMQDIRHISAGLGPPDIDNVSLREALQVAVERHQHRTRTSVRCEFNGSERHIAFPLKACLYRFVQEALSNTYRHADGRGQAVLALCDGAKIEVSVVDEGPGLAAGMGSGAGQGLSGLCGRIESLGGTFELYSVMGKGTRLTASFNI